MSLFIVDLKNVLFAWKTFKRLSSHRRLSEGPLGIEDLPKVLFAQKFFRGPPLIEDLMKVIFTQKTFRRPYSYRRTPEGHLRIEDLQKVNSCRKMLEGLLLIKKPTYLECLFIIEEKILCVEIIWGVFYVQEAFTEPSLYRRPSKSIHCIKDLQ